VLACLVYILDLVQFIGACVILRAKFDTGLTVTTVLCVVGCLAIFMLIRWGGTRRMRKMEALKTDVTAKPLMPVKIDNKNGDGHDVLSTDWDNSSTAL
jgi:hypothetical protein